MINYFSIFDKKIKKFINLFSARNTADAERILKSQFLMEDKALFVQFPEDFQLYKILGFNDDTGDVEQDKELIFEISTLKL